ncbi:hypothetical protein JI721_08625 [Alicyclobacillus cycloheptanicus]|uniref:Membrane protein YhhN n=1 Tax=Alicyclobacillus cycloheptanicus TaxID=1457 RepID=A0ABT9XKY2_9BACL|nr:hypothetical protein [Alicyclobacillus cycloheptanicus]MDQ0190760.1 putative membrane protein YhhN [Alicyclobacillus cycloheptanicus]WDL99855.1 hypothetical protein JI721_08625 [Alicyclobacillus cycloheptanicus]
MNRGSKFGFFLLALVSMVCLALGSVFAADNKAGLSTICFAVSVVWIVLGMFLRRRVMRP